MEKTGEQKDDKYWQKRMEAKKCYSNIGEVWCGALNGFVTFNGKGFTHLIRKGKSLRREKEQLRRFRLLKYAAQTLVSPSVQPVLRKEKLVNFWTFNKSYPNRIVIVIVRQFNGGKKHFFSIMDKRI